MKKFISILLCVLIVLSFSVFALGCSSADGSSSSSSSSSSTSSNSKYDRDAEYIGSQFGISSDEVKDSVERMAGAMK